MSTNSIRKALTEDIYVIHNIIDMKPFKYD